MARIKAKTKEVNGEEVRGIYLPNVDADSFDHIPSAAYEAVAEREDPNDPRSPVMDAVVPDGRFLPFQPAGKRVPGKRIYTVKAIAPDGRVVQLALEEQINNQIASPADFVGLQFYVRKGFIPLFDMVTGTPVFCPTFDCWAEAGEVQGSKNKLGGFCTLKHKSVTEGNEEELPGMFGQGVTTTSAWGGGG
jgi:hypothetical protein